MTRLVMSLLLLLCLGTTAEAAEHIKVGILKVGSSGPVYLAQDDGYFAAQGLDAELVNFEAGSAVAVAVEAGAVDLGVTGLTAGLYNLAAKGDIRVIGGLHREVPGFHMLGFFASRQGWDKGVRSLKDLPGHSIAITTIGSTTHYDVGLLAEKLGFPLSSVRVLPMQTISGSVTAVVGGDADTGLIPSTFTHEIEQHQGRLLGWVGDLTPWQIGSIFIASKTDATRHDMLVRFLAALQKGARAYHDAFTGPGEVRKDEATAPAAIAIIAKYVDEPPARLENELPYVDPELRIDARDVDRQIAWYRSEGMVRGEITAARLIDRRYAKLLP